jgi:hypothetical protein
MNQDLKNQWKLLDSILMYINSVDTEDKTPLEVRKQIYYFVSDLRPLLDILEYED